MATNHTGFRLIHISIGLGALDTLAVILRLLARRMSKADLAIDDLLIVFGLLAQYAMIAIGYLGLSTPKVKVASLTWQSRH